MGNVELVSVKRNNHTEQIYKMLFDDSDRIVSSEKVSESEYPEEMFETLKLMEKFTIAPKSEIFLVIKNLYELNKLRQNWCGIDIAIQDFNNHDFLNSTIDTWVPSNRIGKGEAQFKLLYKTIAGIAEPDFVPQTEESYSIKYFGKNGKSSVLSGEFVDKRQTENLDTPLHNLLKIFNVPKEIMSSPDLLKKITGNVSLDCETFKKNSSDNWEIITLSS
jgi:hypothetical protein